MLPIPCPISPEALRSLVQDDKLTDLQIANHLGETKKRVQSWRKRFKIDALPRWERNSVLPIEGRLKSLLVGSMLGDGRLVRQTSATYYTESHCEAQIPYLKWKMQFWEGWDHEFRDDIPDDRGFPQARLRTLAHGSLNAWQEMFYEDHHKGWKRLIPEVVEHVDALALAIWYLDDGHAGWWPGIIFGASEESREVAWAIFEKFGLKPRWQVQNGKTGTFHMEREDTAERFLEIISPHIPDCMSSKLGPFGFQGPHYQVRQRVTEENLRDGVSKGIPIAQMARELGVSASTVRRRIQGLGLNYKPSRGRPPKDISWLGGSVVENPPLLQGEGDRMYTLLQGGLTGEEVANLYGVHKSTVYRRVRGAGHPPLKTGPRTHLSVEAATTWLENQFPNPSLWKDQDADTRESWIREVLTILQQVKFPYPEQVTAEVRDKKMAGLRAKDDTLGHSTLGLKLCYPFFPNRYHGQYRGQQSAYEAWHEAKVLSRAIKWQFKVGDPVTPRRVLKAVSANARTPTVFRPAVAAALYKRYCQPGDTVWDPCAGFGGRLVGAVAAGVKYIGTDVAPETVEGNKRLAEWLGAGDAEIHLCPAEKFEPPPVQMVMTSPPYFQQEQYAGGEQSWSEYSTFEAWVEGFLKPMVQRGASALTPGGYWVMNIADVKDGRTVYPLVEASRTALSDAGLTEVETLSMPLSNLNRRAGGEPILVWRKV